MQKLTVGKTNDTLSAFISSLKSAIKTKKAFVIVPFSRIIWFILEKFKEKGLISSFSILDRYSIKITLRTSLDGNILYLYNLRRISKKGRRYFITIVELKSLNRHKNYLLLTSYGTLWSFEAIKLNIGGELLLVI
jgi:ribosomal protein S8